MQLTQVVRKLEAEIEIEKITCDQYCRSVTRFSKFLGQPATTSDLELSKVNQFLQWLRDEQELSPTSVKNYRGGLLRVWNFCVDPLELVPEFPSRRVRMPKVPEQDVRAWGLDQVEQLLDAARDISGRLRNGVPASQFLTAWLWLGLESGLRPGDLRLIKWSQVCLRDRLITFAQHKTGGLHTAIFGAETAEALEQLWKYGHERVFPLDKSGIYRWEKILFERAAKLTGFRPEKRQGLGTLRKTHGTEVYREHGLAAAAESLGHSSGTAVARKHYIDSRVRKAYRPQLRRSS